jgi:UrcA family protein
MFRTIAAAVALVGATAASPLMANEIVQKVQGRVSYTGFNLSDSSDVAELESRIDREARQICTRGVPKEMTDGPDIKACQASAIANGKAELARLASKRS